MIGLSVFYLSRVLKGTVNGNDYMGNIGIVRIELDAASMSSFRAMSCKYTQAIIYINISLYVNILY